MNFQEKVPTVKIRYKDGSKEIFTINFEDFNQNKHEMVKEEKDLSPLKPLEEEQKGSLIGSSVQPATWPLPGGKVLQLGTVVAAAHADSGLSVKDWNNLPDNEREKLIADKVAEMLPDNPPAFTVSSTGRGNAKEWHVYDSAGKVVGESYKTQKEAETQRKLLMGK